MSQLPRTPDLAAQRAAMQRLNFLVGNWSGEAHIFRTGAEAAELMQTERAEYKLDNLLLMIEGVGRNRVDGSAVLQALGIISYDDAAGAYWMRAYNDGRYLETQVKLGVGGDELTWGFTLGEVRTQSVLWLNEQGQWTELHEIVIGAQPARKLMEVRVSRHR